MFKRHKMIQEGLTERNELFIVDIIYGLSITMFVPILYFLEYSQHHSLFL